MKKFFKEINLLKLMGIVLGVIEFGLMTTFLILCRGWINNSAVLYVYFVICIFNIVISGGIIYMIGLLIWELIENKKENKNNVNNN
ncbi:hypothetical protein SKUN_001667 [Spiroplasma kunkelii CR2-3x]|uniref:Uncharacterized protein n=1 Tax=Spiroplasma kunkelii CR2-3x TaxID=273035 RepID=A0A0K2JIV1_SPIKU|nr:hypothetical protein [Spiroplasma kunkelii]ALA98524.1 hypothetical protein SKUN_001667 [Spiroplasma kunkelii CR2-3x]